MEFVVEFVELGFDEVLLNFFNLWFGILFVDLEVMLVGDVFKVVVVFWLVLLCIMLWFVGGCEIILGDFGVK